MKKHFIQIGTVMINVSEIVDIRHEKMNKSNMFKVTVRLKNSPGWTVENYTLSQVEEIKRKLVTQEAAEKLRAIRLHVEYKPGRMSDSDRKIINIINK